MCQMAARNCDSYGPGFCWGCLWQVLATNTRLVPRNLSISSKRTSQHQPLLCCLADSRESWRLWPHSTCKALKARRQQRHPANARLAASAAKAQVNLMCWLHIGTSHNLLGAALLSNTPDVGQGTCRVSSTTIAKVITDGMGRSEIASKIDAHAPCGRAKLRGI